MFEAKSVRLQKLKPRAVKCRRSATKSRTTYLFGSLEFLKHVPFGTSHSSGVNTLG